MIIIITNNENEIALIIIIMGNMVIMIRMKIVDLVMGPSRSVSLHPSLPFYLFLTAT